MTTTDSCPTVPPKLTTVHPVSVDTTVTNHRPTTPRLSSSSLRIELPNNTNSHSNSNSNSNTQQQQYHISTPNTPTSSQNHIQWEVDLEALLPAYAHLLADNSIELVGNINHLTNVLSIIQHKEQRDISGSRVIGFSAECKHDCMADNDNSNTHKSSVALLQLSFGSTTVVIQLALFDKFPDILQQLLEDKSIIKVGIGIDHISTVLQQTYHVQLKNATDISDLICSLNDCNAEHKDDNELIDRSKHILLHNTLQHLCHTVLNIHLDNNDIIKRSEWNATSLTRRQVLYAAADSYFPRRILLHLYQRYNPQNALLTPTNTQASQIGPQIATIHQTVSPRITNRSISRRNSVSQSQQQTGHNTPRHASVSPSPLSRRSSSSVSTTSNTHATNQQQQQSPSLTRSPSPLATHLHSSNSYTHTHRLSVTSPLPPKSPLKINKPIHQQLSSLSLNSETSSNSSSNNSYNPQYSPTTINNTEHIREQEFQLFQRWLDSAIQNKNTQKSTKT